MISSQLIIVILFGCWFQLFVADKIKIIIIDNSGSPIGEIYDPSNPHNNAPIKNNPWKDKDRWGFTGAVYKETIYIIGGENYSKKVELYDYNKHKWSEGPDLTQSRLWASAETLKDKIFVCGGLGEEFDELKSCESHGGSGKWKSATTMPTTRHSHMSAVLDNKMYIIGGYTDGKSTPKVAVYDGDADKWSSVAALGLARRGGAAGVQGKGIVVCGGKNEVDKDDYTTCEVLDIDNNKWRSIASLNYGRSGFELVGKGAELYAIGGNGKNASQIVEVLGVDGAQWDELDTPLLTERFVFKAFAV